MELGPELEPELELKPAVRLEQERWPPYQFLQARAKPGDCAQELFATGGSEYEFDVLGTEGVYTVRMPLVKQGDASCSCADHVRNAFTCKHIIAALITAFRLDPRALPAPALLQKGAPLRPGGARGW